MNPSYMWISDQLSIIILLIKDWGLCWEYRLAMTPYNIQFAESSCMAIQ